MKRISSMALWLVVVLLLGSIRLATPQAVSSLGQAPAGDQASYLSVKFGDLKWQRMFPEWGEDSPEIAILRMDPKTQATQLFIHNPRKMHVPRHWHSASETHTILRGTMVFECDGKRDELGPSSFNYIPSKMIHQAWLPDDGLVFITVDSAWDINWVDGPPAPPKKP